MNKRRVKTNPDGAVMELLGLDCEALVSLLSALQFDSAPLLQSWFLPCPHSVPP